MLTLDTIADFTWCLCGEWFHLETNDGCYEWSDPDYGGDNTIRPCGSLAEWYEDRGIPFGRCKGRHLIRDYCGEDVIIKDS